MRIGKRQLRLLGLLGRFGTACIVGDKLTRSLCRLGLAEATGPDGGMVVITPAGLRVLADALDAGRISNKPTKPERQS